jgi:ABC-type multidrug transport system, ATPase component
MSFNPSPIMLRAVGLQKRYGRSALALAGLELEVSQGTTTALVGPNGAGKSTLIKAWIGFERPTGGRVEVAGIDPWRNRPAALARVAYVAQSPSLYRELTVADHLALARTLRPGFDRSLAIRRLEELAIPLDGLAGRLSGGQQAQVSLALALGTRADILLLDEPLASLDPLARREFLHIVRETVRSEGSTVLLSSHVITDVEQACDHLVVLGGGRKLLDSSITEAIAKHAIADGPDSVAPGIVGRFLGPAGESLALIRGPAGSGYRGASLEEVVLGYLASARVAPEVAA